MTIAGLVDSFIFNGAKKLKGEQDSGFGGPGGKMVGPYLALRAALIYSCKFDIITDIAYSHICIRSLDCQLCHEDS